VVEKIRAAMAAGADWVQIREKDLSGRELFDLAEAAVNAAVTHNALIFLNDRLDVALAAGAAGVHLGGESLEAQDVVRWCRNGNAPREFRIGVSCHSVEDVRKAERAGATYVFFGPLFDTPSKREFGTPQGIAKLARACSSVRIPVIAIGGIGAERGGECLREGASGVAAIRMFQEANDAGALQKAVVQLRGAGTISRR
jgi:thiamine-phosphate pyrophosphorylase